MHRQVVTVSHRCIFLRQHLPLDMLRYQQFAGISFLLHLCLLQTFRVAGKQINHQQQDAQRHQQQAHGHQSHMVQFAIRLFVVANHCNLPVRITFHECHEYRTVGIQAVVMKLNNVTTSRIRQFPYRRTVLQ